METALTLRLVGWMLWLVSLLYAFQDGTMADVVWAVTLISAVVLWVVAAVVDD